MTYLEHTSFDKQKKSVRDKSSDIKKVVIVRRGLM